MHANQRLLIRRPLVRIQPGAPIKKGFRGFSLNPFLFLQMPVRGDHATLVSSAPLLPLVDFRKDRAWLVNFERRFPPLVGHYYMPIHNAD